MIIVQDTREQYPWDFTFYEQCTAMKVEKLKTGDYSIEGLEDVITIERKRTTAEIAMNVGSDRHRFQAELERMSTFKYKYIICEFTMDKVLSFPYGSTIPPKRWPQLRLTGRFLAKCLLSYKEKYGIEVIYCCDEKEASGKAMELLEDAYKKEMV